MWLFKLLIISATIVVGLSSQKPNIIVIIADDMVSFTSYMFIKIMMFFINLFFYKK